jgi:hypothetical protein
VPSLIHGRYASRSQDDGGRGGGSRIRNGGVGGGVNSSFDPSASGSSFDFDREEEVGNLQQVLDAKEREIKTLKTERSGAVRVESS